MQRPGAGKRLRQHRHRRHPAARAHRLHAQASQQVVGDGDIGAARGQEPQALHQLAALEQAAAVLGMAAQDLVQRRVVETLGRRAGLDDRAKLALIALGAEPLAERGLAHRVGPPHQRASLEPRDGQATRRHQPRLLPTRAEEFLATRAAPWPGWDRLLPHLQSVSAPGAPKRILDVGCGNGRFGAWLDHQLARAHRYVGLDRSLSLLARPTGPSARVLVDLVASGGRVPFRGAATRCGGGAGALPSPSRPRPTAEPPRRPPSPAAAAGSARVSFWQFATEKRFERRMVSVEAYNRAAASPIDPAQLEEGDFLLRWGAQEARAGRDPLLSLRVARGSGRSDRWPSSDHHRDFRADGREGDLNSYLVARRS